MFILILNCVLHTKELILHTKVERSDILFVLYLKKNCPNMSYGQMDQNSILNKITNLLKSEKRNSLNE